MGMSEYDFGGYATRNDLLCADGRTIRHGAFKDNDGQTVPLVWNHDHADPTRVLGHALLENRDDGVYAYCKFNNNENSQMVKEAVRHGDIRALSIYANKLKQIGGDVIHGCIRELSLVHAGANPGATIDFVMAHGEESEDELVACYDESALVIYHSEEPKENEKEDKKEESKVAEGKEKTVGEVFDTLNEEQKTVVYAIIGQALEGKLNDDNEEEEDVKHNLFDQEEEYQGNVLTHSDMEVILGDAKRFGSLKESYLAHTDGIEYAPTTQNYGINNPDFLFPEATSLNNIPEFIKRDTGWVSKVISGTYHRPFSRIKSVFADITEEDARAKGYMKGKLKKEEVFSLLKRTTTPTTIYKKQKMDRDDIIDITDFDVVSWIKGEMRIMLDEEIARAVLVGDGRLASSDEKINEQNIRPIWKDADLFTVKATVNVTAADTDEDKAKAFIKSAIKNRKFYKGSGTPTLFTTEDVVTDCLLIEDGMGRRLYNNLTDLATALRVKEIVTVEVMEGLSREVDSETRDLMGIIVNLKDYSIGADKGGAVSMFDDFDIDYNQQKYLIETRCSGALTKPFSAMVLEAVTTA